VGAALGAGQAISARLAARASLLAVPLVWVVVAALLLEPDSQKGILWLFTKASFPIDSEGLTDLMHHLRLGSLYTLNYGSYRVTMSSW
jgi:hypothetical protein